MKKILLLIVSVIAFTNSYCSTFSSEENFSVFNIGDIIDSPNDSYVILKELGAGAFGRVYEVENSQGQQFALKSYKQEDKSFSFSPYEDCDREFSCGQLLDHPHIIKSFEVFSHVSANNEETDNLILQLVKGQTVSNTPQNSLPKEEGIQAALDVYDALHYAFLCEYLHLDLHDENVMLSDQAGLMIIDLASFFSFDELLNYVEETTSTSSTAIESFTSKRALVLDLEIKAKDVKKEKGPGRIRREKLKQFFLFHPSLFAQLKQVKSKKKDNPLLCILADASNPQYTNKADLIHSSFYSYYFDRISSMCIKVLKKTNLSREERINGRVEIKKLVWNYWEDVDEGKTTSFHDYLDQLSQVLNML